MSNKNELSKFSSNIKKLKEIKKNLNDAYANKEWEKMKDYINDLNGEYEYIKLKIREDLLEEIKNNPHDGLRIMISNELN